MLVLAAVWTVPFSAASKKKEKTQVSGRRSRIYHDCSVTLFLPAFLALATLLDHNNCFQLFFSLLFLDSTVLIFQTGFIQTLFWGDRNLRGLGPCSEPYPAACILFIFPRLWYGFSLFGMSPPLCGLPKSCRSSGIHSKLLKPVLFYQHTFLVEHLEGANQLLEDTSEKCLCIGFKGYVNIMIFLDFAFLRNSTYICGWFIFLYILREKW